ncbi:MAG TPA: GFA family protein [Rhodanobacteraceae bacterium]|nr:GFA family protein [Rhodanobacteraceae bacterium]
MSTHSARCFCGAVEVELSGSPAAMGYCHCESCRRWSAGPINAFSLWPKDAVRIVKGEEQLGSFSKNPTSIRQWCNRCGGHVLTDHPHWGLVDVYAAVIDDFDFKPGVHVNYQETVLPMTHGITKMKDLPKEMGGSGVVMT